MNRIEFGKLVRALRLELLSLEGGPLMVRELAEKAELTESVLLNIESGRRTNIADDLLALAEALELTKNETKKFFAAASGIAINDETNSYYDPMMAYSKLSDFLAGSCSPAFLIDSFGDIIEMNRFCLELFGMSQAELLGISQTSEINFNLLTSIFAPEFDTHVANIQRGLRPDKASAFFFNSIILFRTITFKHRADPYFDYMLRQMLRKYSNFRANWHTARLMDNDRFTDNIFLETQSDMFGKVSLLGTSTTAITQLGDLKLYIFSPQSPESETVLSDLRCHRHGTNVIKLLPNWPQKPFGPSAE